MRRSILLTLAALGGLLSLISAGLFAALSDTARTGTNQVSTLSLPGSADLKLATATGGSSVTCGTFSDDLASPMITLDDQVPGADSGQGHLFCLRNVGSQTVNLSAASEELSDVETGCTGDEVAFDQTCTPMAQGELGDIVRVLFTGTDCVTQFSQDPPNAVVLLTSTVETPVDFGTLGPNQTRCFLTSLFVSQATPSQRQAAQTDQLTWRFAFTGSV